MAADRRAETVDRAFDQRLAVDGEGERLADAQVVERLALVVDRQDRLALRAADDHLKALVALELIETGEAVETRDGVDVAGEQARDLRRGIVDEAESRGRDRDLAGVAIAVPFLQRDGRAPAPLGELVGTGADRIGAIRRRALGFDDHRGVEAEVKQRVEARRLEGQDDDVGVGSVGRRDRLEEGFLLIGRIGGGALEGEFDVLRRQRLAILEMDALAQLEGQRLGVGRHGPTLGEQRRDGEVVADLRQALEHIVVDDVADRGGRSGGRIEPRRLEGDADRDAVFRRRVGGGRQQRGRGEEGAEEFH